MFIKQDLGNILLIIIPFFVIISYILKTKINKETDDILKTFRIFKLYSIMLGILLMFLLLCLPSTPGLSTRIPETIDQIQKPENLLRYIQDHNRAITRTTDVVQMFLFLFIFGFMGSLFGLQKVITKRLNEKTK